MNLSPRDRRAIVLGAGVLAAVLVVKCAVIPWIDSWTSAREDIGSANAELARLRGRILHVLTQRKHLEELYGRAASKPPEDLKTAKLNLLAAAQDILKSSGFQATGGYMPQPGRPVRSVPGMELVALEVRGKCKLPQLAKCLAAMQKAKTLIFVDRLTATNDEKKPGQLEVRLVLATLADGGRAGS